MKRLDENSQKKCITMLKHPLIIPHMGLLKRRILQLFSATELPSKMRNYHIPLIQIMKS